MDSQNKAANENEQCYDRLIEGVTYHVGRMRFGKVKCAVAGEQKGVWISYGDGNSPSDVIV
jgi:uncharacterized protein (UPF0179 family)